ncbi:sensor histidine kinase [Methanobacterium spitsbergense]|uniref:PAS domain S-box protein n=1 Tax=Methanobacterium spitsbergense TaxID=2874285 RepID=A0A8T5V0Y9_9EURY|nr:histidine kinase dimerization/phosphoacceptor domain -containing protein [Methanobacterium spitsbergense]MBZ2166693.1 PAS domain S-box protein [Methanobacterium spitsbergense]
MKIEDEIPDPQLKMTLKLSFRNALVIGISFLVILFLVLKLLTKQPEISDIFSYSMMIILYVGVAISLYLASNASQIYGKRTETAWAILSLAVVTSIIASIIAGILVVYFNQSPSNSLADIFYLLFFPLFFIGIIIFPSSSSTTRQRFKRFFDILIIMFSVSLVLWIFLITPALNNFHGNFNSLIIKLTYVLGGFLLLLSLIDLIFNRIKADRYAPLLILALGILVLIITESVYVYQIVHGTYVEGSSADLGWILGYLIVGLAGISQYNHQKLNMDNFIDKYLSWHKNYSITPYLALAGVTAAYISLIWAYNTFNSNLIFLEFGVGILIFLVVLRQIISVSENKKLYWKAQEEIALRKEISKSLKESESAYRTIFENTGTATAIIDENNIITLANSEFEKLSGCSKQEIEGIKPWTDFVVKEDLDKMMDYNNLRFTEKEPHPMNYEFRLKDRSSNIKNIYVVAVIIPGSNDSLISLLDVTESKNAEAEIKKSLEEKEILLKEIHHRVKNNLTVISSLLNLQSRYIKDKEDLVMFKESQSRAKSMALIHQRLYDSSDLKRIDFGDYIKTLANDMFHTYVPNFNMVKLNINVEDVMLDVNTAIPLGLILNELLSNSMKYAFPTELSNNFTNGNIDVNLYKSEKGYTLSVVDDGIGFPEDIDLENTDSLGLQLIYSLTNQIDGTIHLARTNGTSFKIEFKEPEFQK